MNALEMTGGVGMRGGLQVSAPFGHLFLDDREIRFWGPGMKSRHTRSEVKAVRLSRGILATRLTVVLPDDSVDPLRFSTVGRETLRRELERRGWPIIDDHRFGRYRPDRQPE